MCRDYREILPCPFQAPVGLLADLDSSPDIRTEAPLEHDKQQICLSHEVSNRTGDWSYMEILVFEEELLSVATIGDSAQLRQII